MLTPEQREHFDTHGYLIIEDALAPIGLDRVRAAYERVQALTEPAWRQSVLDGAYRGGYGNGPDAHTMSNPYTHEPVFLDLANNPRVIPLLEEIVGPELQVMEIVCHWADTPQKRQIMGIHCVHGRAGWDRKDIPYLPEHEPIARAKKL